MLLLTKAIFAIMIGFLSSTLLGLLMLPLLRRLRVGQKISIFVGEAHRKKEGTPTMGGLIFIVPTVVATLLLIFTDKISYTSNLGIVLLVFIGYACIGFLDDFLSLKRLSIPVTDNCKYYYIHGTPINSAYLVGLEPFYDTENPYY